MKRVALALSALILASAGPVRADVPPFAIDRFVPAPPGDGFEAVEGARTDGEQLTRAKLVLSNGVAPRILRGATPIVDTFVVHAALSTALWDRVLFAVSVPFDMIQAGPGAVSPRGVAASPNEGPTIGDVTTSLRIRAATFWSRRLSLAIGGTLAVPVGRRVDGAGDGDVRGGPTFSASGDTRRLTYALAVRPTFGPRIQAFDAHVGAGVDVGAAVAAKFSRRYEIGPELKAFVPLVNKVGGAVAAYGSARARFGAFVLGGALGGGFVRADGSPLLRGLVSFSYVPEGDPDRDNDGVPDRSDACPTIPGAAQPEADRHGCPSDRDGDGIPDDVDACPAEPGLPSNDKKLNGCPPLVDRDHDGIADRADACPDVPGVVDLDPKKNGCPNDRDGDGVPDSQDACPDVPGPLRADPKKRGCPLDADDDGIPDAEDACPTVKGRPDKDPAKNGCP